MTKVPQPAPAQACPSAHSVLGLLAKHWTAGQVKTRLGKSIGNETAAALHRTFVEHLGRVLSGVANSRQLVFTPASRISEACAAMPASWEIVLQSDGDLGRRMEQWFRENLAKNRQGRAVLIGADCPTLGPAELEQAAELLREHDVVVAPANDGGYVLIGLRGPWRAGYQNLFCDMPWSTDSVATITRQRVRDAGLSLQEMAPQEDIDSCSELNRLRQRLAKDSSSIPGGTELRNVIERLLKTSHPPARSDRDTLAAASRNRDKP